MNYRVMNLTTRELVAVLDEREIAISIAHQLASDHGMRERFGVIELTMIYETGLAAGNDERKA